MSTKVGILVLAAFGLLAGALSATPGLFLQPLSTGRFELLYGELAPEQKVMVDDWIHRYGETRGESLDPQLYNELPLSVKTTFAAVTHALVHTALTDGDGNPLMSEAQKPLTALDLVSKLDTVRGRVKGASGDEQYRIYVQLIPDAIALLEESTQFSRGHDNTVFHKGYPQNFRSGNGVPSIQFSIARDGVLADIDVDYRSSKFPVALVNGHLSSANSDVRAGDNYERHVGVWAGLENWWNGWEGLGDWFAALFGARGLDIPDKTEKGDGEVEEAMQDFLQSWLVAERPDVAMSYFSPDIYKCFAGGEDATNSDVPVEQRMYRKMSEAVRVVGNPRRLEDVVQGVVLTALELPVIRDNAHQDLFVLYNVPPERVMEYECGFRNLSIPMAQRAAFRRSGDYVLGTFFLQSGEMRGVTAALLWNRESDGWKMVSFELEPAERLVPDLHTAPLVAQARGDLEADPDFARANEAFIDAWFVKRDFEAALEYVSPASFPCLPEPEPDEVTREPRDRFADALKSVSEFVGEVDHAGLNEAIARVPPWGTSFLDATPDESPVTLIAIPDDAAASYRCGADPSAVAAVGRRGASGQGNFYGSAFRLKLAGGEQPGTFLLLWGREENKWKIISFDVVSF
ncbi:MAG TPA: hypothetical protein VLK65_02335 [Vicinamibacteria bacterium]|nr:hypothetical protein [Vicinamibacteria bacterium]